MNTRSNNSLRFGLLSILIIALSATAFGQTRTWTGAVSTNWAAAGNWSGNNIPDSAGEIAVIDGLGGSNQPVLSNSISVGDVVVSAGTLTINSSLTSNAGLNVSGTANISVGSGGVILGNVNKSGTGTLTLNSGTITGNLSLGGGVFNRGSGIITGNISMSAGSFNGGTTNFDAGNIEINGGTFNSTSGNLLIAGNLTGTGGIFDPNGGTVVFGSSTNSLIDHSGTTSFNNLQINKTSSTATVSIGTGLTKPVSGTLTLTNGQLAGAGILEATGPVSVSAFDGGNGNLLVSGSSTRTFAISAPSSGSPAVLPNVTVNAPNTTVTSTGFGNVSFAGLLFQNVGSVTFGTPFLLSTGNVTNSSGTTLTFNGNYTQSGGSFSGGTSNVDFNADFTLSNGTFTATSANTSIGISFVILGGTFNHNNGTIVVDNVTVSASSFNAFNFTINAPSGNGFSASGAVVTVQGTLSLINGIHGNGTLNAQGNVIVSPTFGAGTGAVSLSGSGNQTYTNNGGGNPRGIWTLNKTGGTVALASDMDLSNGTSQLILTAGTITTDANLLIAGTRTINRTNGFVIGNLRRSYTSAGSRVFDVGTSAGHFPVTVNATAGAFGAATTVTVSANAGALPGSAPALSLLRHWSITASPGGVSQADLTFAYSDADIPVTADETQFQVLRFTTTSITNLGGTLNTVANTATVSGITQFSQWGVGVLAPTSAPVTISGRVVTADGRGISGAVLILAGLDSDPRTVRTNPFGYFRFIAAGGSGYVVSVASKSHTFVQPSIVVNPTEDITNLIFVSTPQRQ